MSVWPSKDVYKSFPRWSWQQWAHQEGLPCAHSVLPVDTPGALQLHVALSSQCFSSWLWGSATLQPQRFYFHVIHPVYSLSTALPLPKDPVANFHPSSIFNLGSCVWFQVGSRDCQSTHLFPICLSFQFCINSPSLLKKQPTNKQKSFAYLTFLSKIHWHKLFQV